MLNDIIHDQSSWYARGEPALKTKPVGRALTDKRSARRIHLVAQLLYRTNEHLDLDSVLVSSSL